MRTDADFISEWFYDFRTGRIPSPFLPQVIYDTGSFQMALENYPESSNKVLCMKLPPQLIGFIGITTLFIGMASLLMSGQVLFANHIHRYLSWPLVGVAIGLILLQSGFIIVLYSIKQLFGKN
ncbi:hypothetical protein [Acidihalobacter prosperus]